MIELPAVIDASVIMAWCFREEGTSKTEAIRERTGRTGAVAPAHWPIEIQNALLVGERRNKASTAEIAGFLRFVRALRIEVDYQPLDHGFGDLFALGRQHGLSAYDAAYVELAFRRGLPLATKDNQMRLAAQALGIELLDTV